MSTELQLFAVSTADLAAEKEGFLETLGYKVAVLGPLSSATFDATDLNASALAEGTNVWCVYGQKSV